MKNVFLILILLAGLINVLLAKDNSVKIIPAKPHPGDEVTVTFNPEGTALLNARIIEMRVYPWSNNVEGKVEKMTAVEMKKEGQLWTAKFKSTELTDIAPITFLSENKFENNEGNGYFIRFYDKNGNENIGSKIGYAAAISDLNWGRNVLNSKIDFKKAFNIMDEVFKADPSQKRNNFDLFITAMLLSKKDDKNINPMLLLEKELTEFANYSNLSDKEYGIIVTYCKRFRLLDKAKELTEKAIKMYPKGEVAFSVKIESLVIGKDIAVDVENLDKEFPWQRNNSEYMSFLNKIIEQKKTEYLKEIITKNRWIIESEAVCSTILTNSLTESFDKEMVALVNEKLNELAKKGLEKPLTERENSVTERQELAQRQKRYGYSILLYARVLWHLNNLEKSAAAFEEAVKIMPVQTMSAKYYEWYVQNLIDNKQFEKAGPLIEFAIKNGKATERIKGLCKDYYVSKNGNDTGYSEYYASLTGSAKNKMENDLKGRLTNTKAPEFSLFDTKGKKIKLSDLKGKIIILDFWATWCGPCKASFPFMKKAVEKYANNQDVQFLFVNTMEKVDNPSANASKFLKDNNYPFHVLIDKDNKVSTAYNVKGIPSKVFIDKEGYQRLFSQGFSENDILDEIDFMIEKLK